MEGGDARAALEFANDALELFRDLGDNGGITTALEISGWSNLELSDPVAAAAAFGKALRYATDAGWKRALAIQAAGFAAALVSSHEEEHGAQLLGAAAAIFDEVGVGLGGERDNRVHDRALAQARAALGTEVFTASWDRGRAMTPDQIVALTETLSGSSVGESRG